MRKGRSGGTSGTLIVTGVGGASNSDFNYGVEVSRSTITSTGANVQVIGVSVDTPFALKAWADQQGYTFPLLSDFWPHGEVAKAYGVFNEQAGMA